MPSYPLHAVAFDLDGTLVDSLADLAAAANAMRQQRGLSPLSAARVQSFVGDGAPVLVARTLADDPAAQVEETAAQIKGRAAFAAAYAQGLATHTRAYAGVAEALLTLSAQGWPLAVITNKPIGFTQPLLQQLGLASFFSVVLGGDSLPTKKPSPAPLAEVCRRWGIAPAALLMVGDSHNDILAARAHGSPVVAVSYGYGSDASQLGADAVLDDLARLPAWLAAQGGGPLGKSTTL